MELNPHASQRVRTTRRARALNCALASLLISSSWAAAETFSQQKATVTRATQTQPEATILALLKAGILENQPAQAAAIAKKWLEQNLPENPELLYQIGRNAELSGDWQDAAAFYQQFLKEADPKSAEASDAITAVYIILIKHLDDIEGAYIFGHREALRLAGNPRFRQFDRWFLDVARNRNDVEAVTTRLLATTRAGIPTAQWVALYEKDALWLIDAIHNTHQDDPKQSFSQELVESVKALSHEISNREVSLLLDWSVSVKAYHMARIAGNECDAPLDAAKVLLENFPFYALRVQTDWAGRNMGGNLRDDPKKYWPHQLQEKTALIHAALGQLSPLQQAQLVQSWSTGNYPGGPDVVSSDEALALTLNSPDLFNRMIGPTFSFNWRKMSNDEAQKLAPKLKLNPSPEASLVRAIAAGGAEKDYVKAMDALLTTEAWRLNSKQFNSHYADQLWHWAGRPGGYDSRNQQAKRSQQFASSIPNNKTLAKTPAKQRLAMFRALWKELQSKQPKTPALLERIRNLLLTTPDAMAELLIQNQNIEAQLVASQLIGAALQDGDQLLSRSKYSGNLMTGRYDPLILRLAGHRGIENLKQNKDLYLPHPLLPALEQAVAKQLESKSLEPWLVTAWLNAQFPDNNDRSVELIKKLIKAPAWKSMPAYVQHGARSWFSDLVMTPDELAMLSATQPEVVCKDLLTLTEDSDASTAADAIKKTTQALNAAPQRVALAGLDQLNSLKPEVFEAPAVIAQITDLIDSFRLTTPHRDFANRLIALATKTKDPEFILRSGHYLWLNVETWHHPLPNVMQLAESMTSDQPEAASSLARIGLAVIARYKQGHSWFKRDTDIPQLKSIRGNTAMQLGLVEIPVPANHRSYPIYLSQAEWMTDNIDSAYKLLDANWETFLSIHRELSMSYLMWALQLTIDTRNDARQEPLIKSLLSWTAEPSSPLRLEEKAAIEIAYGDIAMQRGQLRQAHDLFSRVQKNDAYSGLMIRHQATLRRARAERIAKDFDAALATLAELEMERISGIWSQIRYARAEIHYDMEEYDDAKDDIDSILARDSNHPDSKILLGKIQLKRQKLMEATEVELGSTTSQQSLVPGEKLKVTLSDPTLAVSGAGTEIEVVVWTTTGDREQFFLRQFGDQKTKFRGEVATALGAPSANDGTLQVVGDDEVYYAYTERFREKMNGMEEKRGGPISIASDALLMTSARKLLTAAEQRRADMEAVMEEIQNKVRGDLGNAVKAEMASKAIGNHSNSNDGDVVQNQFGRYLANVAKPGNPIHVRVIDPDRSRTPDIDELTVSVATSSGDSISRVTLRETETHSGWFEGSIPTTNASASALANDSEPGLNPNMVISANPSYPAWRPIPNKGSTPEFAIDLNDMVNLGELTLTAKEPGAKLKKIIVQTAPNHNLWTTVASYPTGNITPTDPWSPSVTVINEAGRNAHYGARSVHELSDLREHMLKGWIEQPEMATSKNVTGPSDALPASIPNDVKWLRSGRYPNPAVVARFQAHFYEPRNATRHFRLKLGKYNPAQSQIKADKKQLENAPEFLMAVNGKVITDAAAAELNGSINLKAGVNQIEIWATGWISNIGFGRSVQLLTKVDDESEWQACPDKFFDPYEFPQGTLDQRNRAAKLSPSKDGTRFNLEFAADSQARLIRFLLIDQESPAPTINKITLTNTEGKTILPLETDFTTLNKNDTLEILTGDRISVRYRDDRYVTPSKERQERFLSVSFTDAKVEFADMEPRWSSRHNVYQPYYEKLLRFHHKQALKLAIHDADMDVSVDVDTVPVTLTSNTGEARRFVATETGDSTGIFQLVITPVTGKTDNDTEFEVAANGTITASYIDHENNRPGVITNRIATITHAAFTEPQFVIGQAQVSPWQPEPGTNHQAALIHGFQANFQLNKSSRRAAQEQVRPRWQINHAMTPANQPPAGGFQAVLGQRMFLELVAPQYALGTASSVKVYAQTDAGRRAASAPANSGFDTSIPGTIELTGTLDLFTTNNQGWQSTPSISTYRDSSPWGVWEKPQDDRFRIAIPLIPGLLPPYGVLTDEARDALAKDAQDSLTSAKDIEVTRHALIVQPGETIHIGFRYTDPQGKEQWQTVTTRATTHPVFDIMSEDYRTAVTTAYAGEHIHLRAVDLGADVSDEIDSVQVLMQAKSGAKYRVTLKESGPHTGIFRDNVLLNYHKEPNRLGEDHDVERLGFPATYGDVIAARYTDGNGLKTETHFVTISKGADGSISPFSKIYQDEEVAMRTQFSLAEAYLEMAKRHRQLGSTELANQEYNSAKLLLSKAMDQFTDPDTRAHAEYLLGTLTMEEAMATDDADTRETRYRAALSRFMNVTGSYPLTLHASKAQYRIATVYEKLDEPEIAAQEYVKLAYKYPDSEFLAISMARLGTHFLKQAATYEARAKPLLAKAETDKDAGFEGEALQKIATREYLKTASIFSRLQERFPSHSLAGPAGLRAGQAYMRADKKREAIQAFNKLIHEESYDGPDIRAQAMYWIGMCHQDLREEMATYSHFKRLTYDFPESKWASYARAQLSQDRLLRLENKLELERLEAGQ